jgi:hypothetical protein
VDHKNVSVFLYILVHNQRRTIKCWVVVTDSGVWNDVPYCSHQYDGFFHFNNIKNEWNYLRNGDWRLTVLLNYREINGYHLQYVRLLGMWTITSPSWLGSTCWRSRYVGLSVNVLRLLAVALSVCRCRVRDQKHNCYRHTFGHRLVSALFCVITFVGFFWYLPPFVAR